MAEEENEPEEPKGESKKSSKEKEPPMTYRDKDGSILYGIPDLNKSIAAHNKHLKKYYRLAVILLVFIVGIILWVIWQIKHYKIISLLINNL